MCRLVMGAVVLGVSGLTLLAQNSGMRPPWKYITAAQVADGLEKSVSEQGDVARAYSFTTVMGSVSPCAAERHRRTMRASTRM